jgi:hypothetical protein
VYNVATAFLLLLKRLSAGLPGLPGPQTVAYILYLSSRFRHLSVGLPSAAGFVLVCFFSYLLYNTYLLHGAESFLGS